MRLRAKTDNNQTALVAALRACGLWVQSLAAVGHGFPDLLVVTRRGRLMLLEVKMPGAALTVDEALWHNSFPGPIYIAYDLSDALRAAADVDNDVMEV